MGARPKIHDQARQELIDRVGFFEHQRGACFNTGSRRRNLLGVTVFERWLRHRRRLCFFHYQPTGSLPTLPDRRLDARRHKCAIVDAARPSGTLPTIASRVNFARSNRAPIVLIVCMVWLLRNRGSVNSSHFRGTGPQDPIRSGAVPVRPVRSRARRRGVARVAPSRLPGTRTVRATYPCGLFR
jgi:hypothetical protein